MLNKKVVAFSFVCLLFNPLFGQKYKKALGINLDFGIATVNSNWISTFDYIRPNSSIGFSYETRLSSSNFMVKTGARLMNRGYGVDGNLTDVSGNVIRKARFREFSFFAEIPLSVSHQIEKFYFGIGASAGLRVHNSTYLDNQKFESIGTLSYPEYLYSSELFAGRNFQINPKTIFSLELNYNRAFIRNYRNVSLSFGIKKVCN